MLTFDQPSRQLIAARLKAFPRQPHDAAGAEGLKRAAVAIALLPADDHPDAVAFALTRRVNKLRAHGGQWALPGGRCDAGETVVQAALREMHEEIGLKLGESDALGLLDDYPTRSGYLITPVVFWCKPGMTPHANPDEVAAIYRIPIDDIAPIEKVSFTRIPESERRVVRINILGQQIHAPTAALLYQFREVLAGRVTRVADLEQPVFAWR